MQAEPTYTPLRRAASRFVSVRGLRYHVLTWGSPELATPERPPLVMLHGWMDVAASFQFVVDALAQDRYVIAPDWRGFGLTETPATDSYWLPDYLGDLEALLDALLPGLQRIDLLGHSMGGNVAMLYAGISVPGNPAHIDLVAFDCTTPTAPRRLGSTTVAGGRVVMRASGSYVYTAAGEPIEAFVPAAVAAEIAVLGLYRKVETGGGGGMLGEEPSERTRPT